MGPHALTNGITRFPRPPRPAAKTHLLAKQVRQFDGQIQIGWMIGD